MQATDNQDSLGCFAQSVARLRRELPRQYDRQVNRDLARQQAQDLLLRNAVGVAKQTYEAALEQLRALRFAREGVSVNRGLSALTVEALKPFDGLADELLQHAVHRHRTSCALSNFPDEHKPSMGYIAEVTRAIGAQWREFALAVNGYLVGD